MDPHPRRHNRPVNDQLHPIVYKSLIGLVIWLLLSIWFLFDRGTYIGLILAMITVFFVILSGIPTLIWLTWRHRADHDREAPAQSWREWASQTFEAWQDRLSGEQAAAQVLLPIMAVAFGMTVFGIVYNLTLPHLGG